MKRLYKNTVWIGAIAMLLLVSGCKKFLNIPLPVNQIAGADAYSTDETTSGVLDGIYTGLQGYLSGSNGVGYNAGLYTDELQNISASNTGTKIWYSNTITGTYGGIWWSDFYSELGIANTTIAAMQSSSLPNKNQWLGEALFVRALLYYYLVNSYGDVALALTNDVSTNNSLSRIAPASVYPQIVADLKQAQGLLVNNYYDFNGNVTTDRARPNLAAATALLARVYLYLGDWVDAEAQATTVLNNSSYKLETLQKTFLVGSQENIWGLEPAAGNNFVVGDPLNYIFQPGANIAVSSNVAVSLSPSLISTFDSGDLRLANWVDTITSGTPATTYYFAYKYKVIGSAASATETLSILRLAEQYLIRAEARAEQGNPGGAASDLNSVRSRAGLAGTTATTQAGLLAAIAKERRVELFTEQGHRFFDLKRTGAIDPVMAIVSPQKGSNWSSFMQYWPIPTTETLSNPNLTQTPGYQQ